MEVSSIWVLALNDGEAAEILRLLVGKGERVLVSAQTWGASWSQLEPAICAQLDTERNRVRMIGIEMQGANRWGAVNIDHHRYATEDRWKAESSLEQMAAILCVQLDRWGVLVAANDRAYIPGMKSLGASQEEIAAVRLHDRRLQGVTAREEAQAAGDVSAIEAEKSRGLVACRGNITAAHSDLLYGKFEEWLLMGRESWEYSGPRHKSFGSFCEGEVWWSGGAEASGYFGVTVPKPATQEKIKEFFLHG